MDENKVNKRNALRQVLNKRCRGAEFEDDDVDKLVAEGLSTAAALVAATVDDLNDVLPGRPRVVWVLWKAFMQLAGGERPLKRLKTSGIIGFLESVLLSERMEIETF